MSFIKIFNKKNEQSMFQLKKKTVNKPANKPGKNQFWFP